MWLVVPLLAGVAGYVVGSTRAIEPLAGMISLLCGWIIATLLHRTSQYAVIFNVLLLVVLTDVLGNNLLSSQLTFMLLAANVGVLLAAGVNGPVQREDVGLALLMAATAFPYLNGGSLDTLPGNLGILVIIYAIGRFGRVRLRSLVVLWLIAGAFHGTVAMAQSVPSLTTLVPFEPLQGGVPFLSGRASGLFNNPNTLGTLEAIVLVTAMQIGLRRWMLPLVILCAVGLILSSSREAVFGLVVGMAVLGIGRFRQAVAWGSVLLIVGVVVVWSFPSLLERFDPAGYATDPNLLGRFDAWKAAVDVIERSPLLGHGADALSAFPFVDNAYLGWLVIGGLSGLVLWIIANAIVTPRWLWPVLAAMFAIAMLANPFSGPVYAMFLSTCGAVAAENARRSPVGSGSNTSQRRDRARPDGGSSTPSCSSAIHRAAPWRRATVRRTMISGSSSRNRPASGT